MFYFVLFLMCFLIFIFSKLEKGLGIFKTFCELTDLTGIPKHAGEIWRNVPQTWLKLTNSHNLFVQTVLYGIITSSTKNLNLHTIDWINKGIFKVKDNTNNWSQIISFEEVERTVGRAPHTLFEYYAVKTALEQARERGSN